MGMVIRCLAGVSAAILLSACGSEEPEFSSVRFDAGGDVVSLGVTADKDRLHATWVEIKDDTTLAYHAISDNGGLDWSQPVAIETGQPPPDRVHRSNDLRIAAKGNSLLVVWQTSGDGFAGSGPMVMARSDDRGKSWRPTATPVEGDGTGSHGFFALSRAPNDAFHIAWLDSRKGQQGVHHAASIDGGQSWSDVTTPQDTTCECCWNSLAHAGDETVVLYRGAEPRDMAVATSDTGSTGWHGHSRVGQFDWYVDGCPHVGGGLATDNEGMLHAVVWTGDDSHGGLYHLHRSYRSEWSAPERLGRPAARAADLTAIPGGGLLAAWDHGTMNDGIGVARYHNGTWGSTITLGRNAQRPRFPWVTAAGDTTQVFWTEDREDGTRTWRITRLPSS